MMTDWSPSGEPFPGGGERDLMLTTRMPVMSLYVDRSYPEHWIVRDREGRFWVLPPGENAWERRRPYDPGDDAELEPVPGHYMYMLGLPI